MIKAINIILLVLIIPAKIFCGWCDSYGEAEELAKACKKPILAVFLEPSGSPWSDKVNAEVLSDERFISILSEKAVLVRISTSELALLEKYRVEEFPSFLLLEAGGRQISRVGFLPLEAEAFANHLKDIFTAYFEIGGKLKSLKTEELISLYQKASELGFQEFKTTLMGAGLKRDKGPFFLMEKYRELVDSGKKMGDPEIKKLRKEILSRDSKNKNDTHLHLAILDFRVLSHRHKVRDNSNEAIEPLLDYVKEFKNKDKKNIWQVEMMMAQYLFSKNKYELALAHAEASYEAAPEIVKSEIGQTVEYMKTFNPK